MQTAEAEARFRQREALESSLRRLEGTNAPPSRAEKSHFSPTA
jgi:hypothetical protein